MLSRLVSTSLTTVNRPSRKSVGRTVATKGMKTAFDSDRKPMATSELDSAMTYSELRAEASAYVELLALCSTKCSVVMAESKPPSFARSSMPPSRRQTNSACVLCLARKKRTSQPQRHREHGVEELDEFLCGSLW